MWFFRKRVEHTCAECGTKFTARADAKFCSQKCKQRAYRKRIAGGAVNRGIEISLFLAAPPAGERGNYE